MDLEQVIKGVFLGLRELAGQSECSRKDQDGVADMALVAYASEAMREKLAAAREKGRGGWWDDGECQVEHLKEMLIDHVSKGDMRDVMNIAAMIYVREIVDA